MSLALLLVILMKLVFFFSDRRLLVSSEHPNDGVPSPIGLITRPGLGGRLRRLSRTALASLPVGKEAQWTLWSSSRGERQTILKTVLFHRSTCSVCISDASGRNLEYVAHFTCVTMNSKAPAEKKQTRIWSLFAKSL